MKIERINMDDFFGLTIGSTVLTLVAASLIATCSGCKPSEGSDYQALFNQTSEALLKCLGGKNGDYNYCDNAAQPCSEGEGDCDSDLECGGPASGLACGRDNGPNFGMPKDYEVCVQPHCTNGVIDSTEQGIDCGGECGACQTSCADFGTENADYAVEGGASYCTISCPCGLYQGDCDIDNQCRAGLRCVRYSGARFGSTAREVCLPAHCANGIRDEDETTTDCGGTCGTCL